MQVLGAYFTIATFYEVQVGDMMLTSMIEQENYVHGDKQHVFMRCRGFPPGKPQKLIVETSPTAEVPVAFWDMGGEVHFPEVTIKEGGNLKAVLQNRWEDSRGGDGYYSILYHAQRLEIKGNSQAVADLVAYVEGTYPLDKHWRW